MEQNFIVTEIERVVMVGKEEYPEYHVPLYPIMGHNELIFHISGQSTVLFDDVVLHTAENTIRFLPKMKASKYEVFQKPGDCILIDFQTDRPVSEKAFTMDFNDNKQIGALFRKIFMVWSEKKEGYYFECLSLLYAILAQMSGETYLPPSVHHKIEPAALLIHNEFLNQKITVAELAALCNISESYLKRLFSEKYGMSVKKYITQLKINRACELLRQKQHTISHIAELCNFSDVYFFSRQFKKYVGVTPTQFIKKYQSSK